MTPSEIADWHDGAAAWMESQEAFHRQAAATIRDLEAQVAKHIASHKETIERERVALNKLKIATEALERFDSAYVIEPNGAIIGLERWHLEGVKQALARIKKV